LSMGLRPAGTRAGQEETRQTARMDKVWQKFVEMVGSEVIAYWLIAFVVTMMIAGIWSGFFKSRKIQPRGFKWKTWRNEILVAVIGGPITGFLLGGLSNLLNHYDLIAFKSGPVSWWVVGLEYALYFVLFDTWFYWWHRLMHK